MVEISAGSELGNTIEGAEITNNTITDDKLFTKTSYVAVAGSDFLSEQPDVHDVTIDAVKGMITTNATMFLRAKVQLPDGAEITGAVVYGSESDETFTLRRVALNNSGEADGDILATGNMNTEDTTISNGTVDNSAYSYWIHTSSLDATDVVYGARIKYTTKHI